jgi:ActR/RegA family two-component response regulator
MIEFKKAVEAFEREYMSTALEEHDGCISETARATGVHRRQLQRKLTQLGLRGGPRRKKRSA